MSLANAPPHLDTTTGPERGHPCPQLRSKAHAASKAGGRLAQSELAADKNVRAPAAVSRCAPNWTTATNMPTFRSEPPLAYLYHHSGEVVQLGLVARELAGGAEHGLQNLAGGV